jgi:uncharacterized protein YdaU (DUF1376 family)
MTDARPVRRLQYMPFRVAEHLALTILWTGPEAALLVRLQGIQWESGPLPLSVERLAWVAKYPLKDFRRLWAQVSTVFEKTPEGWVCPRTEEERERSLDVSKKRAEAGSKGGSKPKQRGSSEQAIASDLSKQSGQGLGIGTDDSPSVPAPPVSKPPVQSLPAERLTGAQRAHGPEDFPTRLTPEIEALILEARPECDPAAIFPKWLAHNQENRRRDWRGSLKRFAAMERFDETQWEARKRSDRERESVPALARNIEQATKRVTA